MPASPEHAPAAAGGSFGDDVARDHGIEVVSRPSGGDGDHAAGSAAGRTWCIAVARFNAEITEALLEGAVRRLIELGAAPSDIHVVTVPGAMELPLAAQQLARAHGPAAVVVAGCVIRGETPHFDYVCRAAVDGCLRVQLDAGIPIGFGVLTVDSRDQALARAQVQPGGRNVGADAASAAVEVAHLAAGAAR